MAPMSSSPRGETRPSDDATRNIEPISTNQRSAFSKYNVDAGSKEYESSSAIPGTRRHAVREWIWEFMTWFIGSLSLAITILLMVLFRDKPSRNWHSEVQITTIVAALAQLSQSMLLVPTSSSVGQLKWKWFKNNKNAVAMDIERFDKASRGPEGSSVLLFQSRFRVHLVSLGAISIIAMLAFPTFLQQALNVELKSISDKNSNAQIFRATTPALVPETMYLRKGDGTYDSISSPALQGAAYSGLYNTDLGQFNTGALCPTNVCEWDPYVTLAICSSTEDISTTVVRNNAKNISIPGMNIAEGDSPTFWVETHYLDADKDSKPQYRTANNSDSNLPNLAEIFVAYWDPCSFGGDVAGEDYHDPKKWKAYKGTLRYCLQTLKSKYNSSVTTTEILHNKTDINWFEKPVSNPNSTYTDTCYEDGNSGLFCTPRALGLEISAVFKAEASMIIGGDNYVETRSTPQLIQDIIGIPATRCSRDAGIGYAGFSRRIDSLALGITNFLRRANGSTIVEGSATITEQYILVDFPWLAMPVGLWAIITLFFFLTVWQTRSLPAWKSSQLVLLDCQDPNNQLANKKEVKEKSKNLSMALQKNASTWYLR